jgi:hypothetical protein
MQWWSHNSANAKLNARLDSIFVQAAIVLATGGVMVSAGTASGRPFGGAHFCDP